MRNLGLMGLCAVAIIGVSLVASAAHAQGRVDRKLFGADYTVNGLVRYETAISTTSDGSVFNQNTMPANGVAIRRNAGNPATGYQTTLAPDVNLGGLLGIEGLPGLGALPPTEGVSNLGLAGVSDTIRRPVPYRDNDINVNLFRFELSQSLRWGESWSLQTRLRALYHPHDFGVRDHDARSFAGINGGVNSEDSQQHDGKPSHLGWNVNGEKRPIFFEYSSRNFMADLPAFFLQWTNGQTTLRLGNQSVAWGQLLFFRIMDVSNGLDLRRHLFLDRAIEEYADERMSAPGLRVTHQLTDRITADAFVQQFIPTVIPNRNTPYNLVHSAFFVQDRYAQGGYDNELNYGIRFKGEYGNFNLQAMATRRFNPLGAIRWAASEINKPLPSSNLLGAAFNRYCEVALASPLGEGCGPQLAQTAFEASPGGVYSAEEWFQSAGSQKLDALDGLDRAIDEFPVAEQIFAQPINGNVNAANNQLDAFFIAGEGLRGHVERLYFAENVFGIGGGYVLDAEPGSIFDQMIFNVEMTYTPNRTFIGTDLRQSFDVRDEYQFGLVVEKYHRFSTKFPATYMLFQYLWQKESDLAGLLLDGYGSENFTDQGVELLSSVPTSENPDITPGLPGGAHYVVFAALQPTDAYIFEYSVATLFDVQGGMLAQPAVQWKPRGNITVNLYYNYVNDDLWGGNSNKNLFSLIGFANEAGIRLGYQF